MSNSETRTAMVFLAAAALAMTTPLTHASVVLSNATTSVKVNGGEAGDADPLIDYDGFFNYTDLATGEETTWSIDPVLYDPAGGVTALSSAAGGGFGAAALDAGDPTGSTASVAATTVGAVTVGASTTLSGTHAVTTFTFSGPSGALDGHTFLFYAENDIFGFADDVAGFGGSIAGGDLELVMYDSTAVSGGAAGLTVFIDAATTGGAVLSSFGSGIWTGFGDMLKVGDLSALSADGSTFVTGPADLGLALAFTLSGDSATVVVDYYTTPDLPPGVRLPEPATVLLTALGLLGLARRRLAR